MNYHDFIEPTPNEAEPIEQLQAKLLILGVSFTVAVVGLLISLAIVFGLAYLVYLCMEGVLC